MRYLLLMITFITMSLSQNSGMYFADGNFISLGYSKQYDKTNLINNNNISASFSHIMNIDNFIDNAEFSIGYNYSKLEFDDLILSIMNEEENSLTLGSSVYFKTTSKQSFFYNLNFKF